MCAPRPWYVRRVDVPFFSPQRPGPEQGLVDAVVTWGGDWLSATPGPSWVAGGVPIGAGEPDLVLTHYRAELAPVKHCSADHARVLAFLRGVRCATPATLAMRLSLSEEVVIAAARQLCAIGAVTDAGSTFVLRSAWREILQSTVAIEAKVSDWRRAARQAARNRLFAHLSFVALPSVVANRVASDPLWDSYRIGVLAVAPDGTVTVARRAPRSRPLTWFYHYYLALGIASHMGGPTECRSLFRSTTPRSSSPTMCS